MKKFIFFLGFFYVITFFSCQQKNNKESFADIIKNDSSRVQELLDEAALLNKAGTQQNESESLSVIDEKDTLSPAELENFRRLAPHGNNERKHPTVIVASSALQELIGNPPQAESDSVIFYLGKYPQNDLNRIRRYNARNRRPGDPPYTHGQLGFRITFAIQSRSESNKTFIMSKVYDIGRLCPPPSTGCF